VTIEKEKADPSHFLKFLFANALSTSILKYGDK